MNRKQSSFPTRRSSDLAVGLRVVRRRRITVVVRHSYDARRQRRPAIRNRQSRERGDRKSTRLNSSHVEKSYAVFCLKKKRMKLRNFLAILYTHRKMILR